MKSLFTITDSAIRPTVAIAGTSGFIGTAVCRALARRFEVVALTRSMVRAMSEGEPGVEVRNCDHFARRELGVALKGADYSIYLVRNWDPSARLDQAQARDMDLLIADNFAWAAARANVKQIVFPGPLLASERRFTACNAREIEEVLASHGVPVTVLRTGLLLGPAGELSNLLTSMVRRLPIILLPSLAENKLRLINLEGFLSAVQHCVGNPETFGQAFDLYGPDRVSLRWLLEETAKLLGRQTRLVSWPTMPNPLFKVMLKFVCPSLHPDFLTYLLDMFSGDTPGKDNPVEQKAAKDWKPIREVLDSSVLAAWAGKMAQSPQRALDDEIISRMQRVRSIQRLRLPDRRNAEWLTDYYFSWLGNLLPPFIKTERASDGSWTVYLRPSEITLLHLTFKPDHSSPDRRMFLITGGALARFLGGRKARLEFRDLLKGRFSMVAIHDFAPALPWFFYRFTHAVVHALVMKGFKLHMKELAVA